MSVIVMQNEASCKDWTFGLQMPTRTLENVDIGICGNRCLRWNNLLIDNVVLIKEHAEQDFGGQLCSANLFWWWWRRSLLLRAFTFCCWIMTVSPGLINSYDMTEEPAVFAQHSLPGAAYVDPSLKLFTRQMVWYPHDASWCIHISFSNLQKAWN